MFFSPVKIFDVCPDSEKNTCFGSLYQEIKQPDNVEHDEGEQIKISWLAK